MAATLAAAAREADAAEKQAALDLENQSWRREEDYKFRCRDGAHWAARTALRVRRDADAAAWERRCETGDFMTQSAPWMIGDVMAGIVGRPGIVGL